MYRHEPHDGYPSYWLEGHINGRKIDLLVDTGSSLPAISKEFVERNGLEYSSEQIQASGMENSLFDIVRPSRFRIGRLVALESVFFVLDTASASELLQREVEGIVGGGLFNSNRYSISFKDNLIRYGRFPIDSENMYPLEIDQQYLYASVAINGVVDRFLIDSGALQTQVSLALAREIMGDLSKLEFDKLVRVTVDGRSNVEVARLTLRSLSFGDLLVKDYSVFVGDHTRNIIGMDLLKSGVLTVDPESLTFGYSVD